MLMITPGLRIPQSRASALLCVACTRCYTVWIMFRLNDVLLVATSAVAVLVCARAAVKKLLWELQPEVPYCVPRDSVAEESLLWLHLICAQCLNVAICLLFSHWQCPTTCLDVRLSALINPLHATLTLAGVCVSSGVSLV